MKMTFWK